MLSDVENGSNLMLTRLIPVQNRRQKVFNGGFSSSAEDFAFVRET